MRKQIKLSYYSDVLCFWAYAAQIRLDELQETFAEKIIIKHHFISVFGNTGQRIGEGWKDRGGYAGFAQHIADTAKEFPHLRVNPEIWQSTRPKTSAMSHCFLKAVQLLEEKKLVSTSINASYGKTVFEETLWRVRCAFFEDALDIGNISVLKNIAEELQLPMAEIEQFLNDGTALASLMSDMEKKELLKLEGSPSYVMNDGRQKLYGNIGYRVIEANV
ncbi:MAG: DsbA family protein, partial [Pseudomonadota bacterium]|nr:DsbA family protein [Pseudomonadota bacterium]